MFLKGFHKYRGVKAIWTFSKQKENFSWDGFPKAAVWKLRFNKINVKISKILKSTVMGIIIAANLKVMDFLDFTFDPNMGTYKTFNKPNNTPLYVHKQSSHPPQTSPKIYHCQLIKGLAPIPQTENFLKKQKGPF